MKLFVFSVLILTISLASALEISVQPEVIFSGQAGEEICGNLSLFSDNKIILNAEDRWSKESARDLSKHTKTSEELGIGINYEKSFIISGKKNLIVCVKSGKNYHGALLFRSADAGIGLGTWLELDLTGGIISEEGRKEGITLNSLGEDKKVVFTAYPLLFLLALNFLTFFYLLRKR